MKKKICSVLEIILIIFICLLLFLNVCSNFNISLFGFRIYHIASSSMYPTLKINNFVIVHKEDDYKIGDIVTYQDSDMLVTHRIVERNGETIVTKGDNNNVSDEPFKEDKIVGKVVLILKANGFISYLITKPFTWVLLAILIGVIYLIRK